MRDELFPVDTAECRLGLKLDPDDVRIIWMLYLGGVCPAGEVRASVGLSRLTFFLRVRRLKRASVLIGGPDAIDADLHNLNLTVDARRCLFALEAEVRAGGVFEGRLTCEGTGTRAQRLSL